MKTTSKEVSFTIPRLRQVVSILALLSLSPAAWSATYYVATNGSDTANGTSLTTPFRTVQKAMNTAVGGDTVNVRGGTYREEVSVYKGGGSAGKYVTLQGYGSEVPVLKGSDIVSGWTLHGGNIWKKTNWAYNSQQVFVDLKDGPSLQQIGMPSSFYSSFEYPKPVGSGLSSMVAGSFYYDAGAKTLYVWLPDGSSPNNHTIEASTRRRILFMSMPYIYVKGIAFRHTSTSAYTAQGSAIELSSYSVMDKCDVQYADFAGVGLGYLKTGAQLINSNVSNNGNSGVNGPGSYNVRVGGNIIKNNNTRNFNALWHAGGIKITTKGYGLIDFNEVGNNNGSGIWFDYANSGSPIVIKSNYIHDNGPVDSAIFMEVSKNGLIYNNVLVNNTRRGVYISASDNMRVYNNTIVGTKGQAAIDVHGMPRSGATLTGNAVNNNIISGNTAKYDINIATANGSTIANNASDYNNIYRGGGAIQLSLGSLVSNLLSWSTATKQDAHSMSANPMFVTGKIGASNYALQSSSPVINKGTALSGVTDDYAKLARPAGGVFDMGAFEFGTAGTPTPTPSPTGTDTIPPVVSIDTPAQDGTSASGSVSISASATDNVAVKSMTLYVDGSQKAYAVGSQVSFSWSTAGARIGTHTIMVSASDGKNSSRTTRTVRVN